ncbi:MAG TPA: hypothetical protein VEF53_09200 [Patescibacteria group bacterium]|nr:hypothetical protein [Patescibacteria group bacterium]
MENKLSLKAHGKFLGVLSISIPIVVFLLILNWFFKITPYQNLQGMPLLIAPFASLIGFVLGYIAYKKSPDSLAKWSIVMNTLLFISPFLYWTVGTLIFGA